MAKRLKLSQCMIVKNEEDNIERALSWGKKIAFEQIVVDTGSTDRTVELAKKMGAKVFDYKWKDDFSAAKNYALEQASGDWIAFLDADEYFREEDVPYLRKVLTAFDQNPSYKKVDIIRCTMLHLEDDGKPFSSMKQDRIFRNHPYIRYQYKIHEALYYKSGRKLICAELGDSIPIMHTGYSQTARENHDKGDRNLSILEKELERDPQNYDTWAYYADSLLLVNKMREAKEAYWKVVRNPDSNVRVELLLNSIANLIRYSIDDPDFSQADLDYVYNQYLKLEKKHPDVDYWSGLFMYHKGIWREAARHLEKAFADLEEYSTSFTLYIMGCLDMAYNFLTDSYLKLNNKAGAVKSISLSLKVNKYQETELAKLAGLFFEADENAEAVFAFLGKLYDFGTMKDRLFVLKEIKKIGYTEVEKIISDTFTMEEREWMETGRDKLDAPSIEELRRTYPSAACENQTDRKFLTLLYRVKNLPEEQILKRLEDTLDGWKEQQPKLAEKLEAFYREHPFWGTLDLAASDYTVFKNRIRLLKTQADDFLWLYSNLADYRSKRTLTAILENWCFLVTEGLDNCKERGCFYFDPDIIKPGKAETVMDLEAGKGDYVRLYTEQCGMEYQHIYCCEERPEYVSVLRKKTSGFPRVTLINGTMPEDEDLKNVTLMRINARENTFRVLEGYEEFIGSKHPDMAVSNYFANEDMIRIPKYLKNAFPGYRLYMRYFGEDLIPTDYVLYAVQS